MNEEKTNNYNQFKKYYRFIGPIIEKPKARAYTAAIFSFLAISLFSWYAIKPTIRTILHLRREIKDKTLLNEKMDTKIANLIEAQAVYEEAINKLSIISESIPDNPDALDSVLQLKNMISSTEATVSSISISPVPLFNNFDVNEKILKATNKSPVHEYTINLVLSGPYLELEKCLQGITLMRRILTMDSFNITTDNSDAGIQNSNNQRALKLSLQLKSYYK